jgi:hypothetical protein
MSQQARLAARTQQKATDISSIKGNMLQRAAINPAITPVHSGTVQRCSGGVECSECQQKRLERKGALQRTAVNSAPSNGVPPIVHDVLNSSGQPLDAGTRAFMEPRFGHDFSRVRVHTDARAVESAHAVNALAYTVGRDVVFGAGQYAPGTMEGKRLMAHELTHVVQQGNSLERSLLPLTSFSIGNEGTEKEAESIAEQLMSSVSFISPRFHTVDSRIYRQVVAPARPTSENVWGFPVTHDMCPCQSAIRDSINWANLARDTYQSCDRPTNRTGEDVERCFHGARPKAVVDAETSESGVVTLPPTTSDPCERITRHATGVHEHFHAVQADRLASSLGPAFLAEWNRLGLIPDRLDQMRPRFPREVATFETNRELAGAWIKGEVESYTWERRFLTDALSALHHICP